MKQDAILGKARAWDEWPQRLVRILDADSDDVSGGTSMALTTTKTFTSAPINIDATFAPGGDFDWVLLFGISGQQFGTGS